jgi:hypothetical protein
VVVVPVGVVLVLVVMLARSSFDPLAFVLVLTRLLLYLMASALAPVLAALGALVCPSYLSAVVPVAFALVLRAGLFVVLVGVGRCWCVRRTRRGGAGGVGPFVVLVGAEVVLACLSVLVGAVLVAFVLVLVACLLF